MAWQGKDYTQVPIIRHDPMELLHALTQGYQASQMPVQAQRAGRQFQDQEAMNALKMALLQQQAKGAEMQNRKKQQIMELVQHLQGAGMGQQPRPDNEMIQGRQEAGQGQQEIQQGLREEQQGVREEDQGAATEQPMRAQPIAQPQPAPIGFMDKLQQLPPEVQYQVRREMGIPMETAGEREGRDIRVGRAQEFSKLDTKQLEKAYDTGTSANKLLGALDSLDAIASNPVIKDTVGPINSALTKYFGEEKGRKALGQIEAVTGELIRDMASGFKGAFSSREQSMITRMKPNASDTLPVFRGKLEALQNLTRLQKKRAEIITDLMSRKRNPLNYYEAEKQALDSTKHAKIFDKYAKLESAEGLRKHLAPGPPGTIQYHVQSSVDPGVTRWVEADEARKLGVIPG